MKTKYFTLIITILLFTFSARGQEKQSTTIPQKQVSENEIYKLFPTKNIWTFIKLDTRNGLMWQIHFSVNDDSNRGSLVLNSMPLGGEQIIGRYTLYPTENIYNFLLLDKIDGTVIQVQWSMEAKNRGIQAFIKPID